MGDDGWVMMGGWVSEGAERVCHHVGIMVV